MAPGGQAKGRDEGVGRGRRGLAPRDVGDGRGMDGIDGID